VVDGLADITARRRDEEADAAVLRGVLRGWKLVVLLPALALLGAVAFLRAVPPEHTAVMVVGPTSSAGFAAMGARIPVVGREAASAAEQGSSAEALSDFARFLHLLTSVPVAERLMADHGLLRRMFGDRWDPSVGAWVEPVGALPALRRLISALVGRADWIEPDERVVARFLRDRVVVEPVGTGPMRRVLFRHPDRGFALAFLRGLVAATDAHLRAEASRRSAAQIEYAQSRLAMLSANEHRKALAELKAEQERVLIMMDVGLPFAADVVEPPSAERMPDWPNVPLVLGMALATGFFAALLLVGFRAGRRPSRGGP